MRNPQAKYIMLFKFLQVFEPIESFSTKNKKKKSEVFKPINYKQKTTDEVYDYNK